MTTYDQWKTDSGYAERSPEQENEGRDCSVCGGDCAGANPPVYNCPVEAAKQALTAFLGQVPRTTVDDLYFQNGIRRSEIERRLNAYRGHLLR